MVEYLGNEEDYGLQVQVGGQQVQQASRAVRAAVIREAEAVVCTLSSAGGELLAIQAGGLEAFDAVIIDEASTLVRPILLYLLSSQLCHDQKHCHTLVLRYGHRCRQHRRWSRQR